MKYFVVNIRFACILCCYMEPCPHFWRIQRPTRKPCALFLTLWPVTPWNSGMVQKRSNTWPSIFQIKRKRRLTKFTEY